MTLLVAVKGRDGLVMASDSRGTFGDPRGQTAQNDSQQKAHVLSNHAALLIAGSAELATQIVSEVERNIQQQGLDGASNVVQEVRTAARMRMQEWFPTLPAVLGPKQLAGQEPGRPDITFVVGGYDATPEGRFDQPVIYSLPGAFDFPPSLHAYGFAVAGVPMYALYLLNRLYEPDRSIRELMALSVYVITETASQDGKVGGPVQVITVKPDKGCESLTEEAVQQIIAANAKRATALRDSFYQRRAK